MALFVAFVLALAVSYVVSTTIYCLFFHPLSSVPGPFLCRFSTLPSFYHACKGDRHVWIWQNHQKFGSAFRAAPNLVLFNSTRAYNDVHGLRANIKRGSFYKAWKRNENDVQTISSTEPKEHAKKRKLLNLVFTEQSLKAASPLLISHIDRWMELLRAVGEEDSWSPPRNMSTHVDQLVFDILGDLCFAQKFDTKEPGENKLKHIPHLIMRQVAIGYKLSKSPLFDLIVYLQPRGLNTLMERARKKPIKEYNAFIEGSLDARIASHKTGTSAREDMIHFLLTAVDPDTNEPAFSNRYHLLSETRLLVLAGTDTTALALSAIFFYLSHNPTVLEKLTAELRTTFTSINDIMLGSTLSGCKYLRACIDESLRLSHPAPGELPREVLPGGAVIDGRSFPAGTHVGCSAWAMGRNKSIYGDDAETYQPERWIASSDYGNSVADIAEMKKAFHPFSIGSMNCTGQNLATLELLLVTARTVWSMEMRIAPGTTAGEGREELGWGQQDPMQYVVEDSYLCFKNGPILQFKKRAA
ncbi:benzoate 4-monooxygenase cytochrome P450 [Periconia macrospinosa]|uniref:Benzoate 4-monooxygenase cytochrome P450 n=1 Tax=Periconia macrospinosa TaxID=97972 RepID=A0A2V1DSZ8_9PLEO|nr:benzoate 4-monooxygenase cytochrome P450 [Periconia macrospinosa]